MRGLAALRAFARPRPEVERCDLCAQPLAERHEHLLDPAKRDLRCACTACALLFPSENRGWKRVPPRAARFDSSRIDDAAWAALGLPIGLAFLVKTSAPAPRLVAHYPSPAGATESQLDLEAAPFLDLEPDIEALLVNRTGARRDAFIVSIDRCFALVGLIRRTWRGFSGGEDARASIDRFFDDLAAEVAVPLGGAS
jgi:hypothetical protein